LQAIRELVLLFDGFLEPIIFVSDARSRLVTYEFPNLHKMLFQWRPILFISLYAANELMLNTVALDHFLKDSGRSMISLNMKLFLLELNHVVNILRWHLHVLIRRENASCK
jgi:hypothetical protein